MDVQPLGCVDLPTLPARSPRTGVVLVEDSSLFRHRVETILYEAGDFAVLGSADSAAAAIELTADLKPAVLVLDLHLRDSSGLAVLEALGARPGAPAIVVLAGDVDDASRARCLALGAAAVLCKQVDTNGLPAVLRDAVQRRRRGATLAAPATSPADSERFLFEAVAKVSAALAQANHNPAQVVMAALASVGELAAADRAYLYRYDARTDMFVLNRAWLRPGMAGLAEPHTLMPASGIAWSGQQMRLGKPVVLRSLAELPVEARDELALAGYEGVRAVAAVPLVLDGQLLGVVAVDSVSAERDWPPVVAGTLRLFGHLLASVLDRSRSLAELESSEQRYQTLVEHAPVGIARVAPDGRILIANQALATLLGFGSPEELKRSRNIRDCYAEPTDREPLLAAMLKGGVAKIETRWKRADGGLRDVVLNVREVRDRAGRIEAFEGFIVDATPHHALERQLQQAQKMEVLGQLAGGLAHDLGNVLSVIHATTDLLHSGLKTGAGDIASNLDDLRTAARQAREVVLQLMAVGRPSESKLLPLDLADLVRQTTALIRRVLPETVNVTVALPDQPVIILGDRGGLEQALMNLATNARDAMPGGGDLLFKVRQQGGRPELIVRDVGLGMTEDVRSRIFDPFFTTKPVGHGTGLGLSMVAGAMHHHHGGIRVESAPGMGTTFVLDFPGHHALSELPAPERPAKVPSGRGESVLLVEDQPQLRRVACRILELAGYRVVVATDGEEALGLMTQEGAEALDLVISDVVMPRMTGPELYEAARWLPHRPRFLFVSGYSEQEAGLAADGPVAFLQKPWTRELFLTAVREVLDHAPTGSPA